MIGHITSLTRIEVFTNFNGPLIIKFGSHSQVRWNGVDLVKIAQVSLVVLIESDRPKNLCTSRLQAKFGSKFLFWPYADFLSMTTDVYLTGPGNATGHEKIWEMLNASATGRLSNFQPIALSLSESNY